MVANVAETGISELHIGLSKEDIDFHVTDKKEGGHLVANKEKGG